MKISKWWRNNTSGKNQTFLNMRDFKDIKVAVAGTGYVGQSIATLLAQHHHVTAVDVISRKGVICLNIQLTILLFFCG